MPHERQKYGQSGEDEAARHLLREGYRIIETNYKNRFGEIDIIARDGETIVFIEVKARRSAKFGTARASVHSAKKKKLSMVALGYLKSRGNTHRKARFDVVCVDSIPSSGGKTRVALIRNAFDLAYG